MIKINPLDAHDRMQHFTKQEFSISECCQDLIDQRPFGNYPFYIWAHARTDENVHIKRLIWQPRLTRPKPQTNSMLFKAYPGTDTLKIIWIIPTRELWGQYEKGKVTSNEMIHNSIQEFQHHRKRLEQNEEDDFDDEKINQIYKELACEARRKKAMDKLYLSK